MHEVALDSVHDRYEVLSGSIILHAYNSRNMPSLSRIDPYRDTVLESWEAERLLGELSRLRDVLSDESEQEMLSELTRIAKACHGNPGSWLLFEGD
ncbi:hypothetical protein ACTMTI_53400 [Nonomuraea sp. H19]|uniref:hypothetical protein n=1 Tax=Nonomuraea sp. H19 TaxID=3452206 RepID=UPI003F8C0919